MESAAWPAHDASGGRTTWPELPSLPGLPSLPDIAAGGGQAWEKAPQPPQAWTWPADAVSEQGGPVGAETPALAKLPAAAAAWPKDEGPEGREGADLLSLPAEGTGAPR